MWDTLGYFILLILFLNFSGEIVKIEEDPLFSEQKILKKRKLTDKRDKSYACGKCDYVATQLCHLKTHTDQAYICLIHF